MYNSERGILNTAIIILTHHHHYHPSTTVNIWIFSTSLLPFREIDLLKPVFPKTSDTLYHFSSALLFSCFSLEILPYQYFLLMAALYSTVINHSVLMENWVFHLLLSNSYISFSTCRSTASIFRIEIPRIGVARSKDCML